MILIFVHNLDNFQNHGIPNFKIYFKLSRAENFII